MSAVTGRSLQAGQAATLPRTPPTHSSSQPIPAGSVALPSQVSQTAIPLGKLLRQASRAVQVGLPDAVWVVASVAAIKTARGGYSIELVEPDVARAEAGGLRAYMPDSVIEAVRRSTGQAVSATDLAGMTVVANLSVELHARWGLSGRVLALGPGIEASLAKRALEASVDRLRRAGLFDRQRSLPAPRDVTCLAVVHPPAAAGWADIAAELTRWAAIGLITVRSVPAPFEGPGAAASIAAAVARAAVAVDGVRPDIVLLVRGGGAALSLGALDDEALARAIATTPVPIVTGLGHASDARTLADRVAWRSVDTPSKSLALVRDTLVAPARRARADYASILAAVSAAIERAAPRLASFERLATAEALRQVVAASQRLDRGWGAVREAAEGLRGRLTRVEDGVDRMAADVVRASPLLVGRTTAELAALMEAIRARARKAAEGADDGARHLTIATQRAVSLLDRRAAELATLARAADTAAATHLDRADAGLDALARTVRERGHQHAARADNGARALALVEAAVAETLRAQDAAIARLHETVEIAVERRVDAGVTALDRALATLDGADPDRVLRRGYVLVMDGQGRVVSSVAAARAASTSLNLTFADGSIAVRPTQTQSYIGNRS